MSALQEAMSFDDVKNFISPDKLKRIEGGEESIEKILPTLTQDEQRYLEYIASERYKEVIKKLERITGKTFNTTGELYPVLNSAMELLSDFVDAEKSHKQYLEALAVQVVLDLPQFKKLKELYDENEIIFDVTLGPPTISIKSNEEEENEEKAELEIVDKILQTNLDDEQLKRKFANMMIQGGSVSYFDVFRMVQAELEQIKPGISQQYSLFMGIVDALYWVTPEGISMGAPSLGANEIDEDDHGIPIIRAQGIIFPVLVHEIIKSALELIASSAADVEDAKSYATHLQARKDIDKLESETFDIMVGPALWKRLQTLLDVNDQEYLADVFKKILQLPVSQTEKSDTINKFKKAVITILQNNNQSKTLIDSLVKDVKEELKDFEKSEWEDIEKEKGYTEDEDGEDDDGLAGAR